MPLLAPHHALPQRPRFGLAQWICLCGCLLAALGGCTTQGAWLAPDSDSAAPPLADAHFAPPEQAVGTDDLFTLSPAMAALLQRWQADRRLRRAPERTLLAALYDPAQLALDYDDGHTRTAAEAFAERRGNCLSLVLMTAAFAKALNLPVEYRVARRDGDDWQRNGVLWVHADHVQLVLGEPLAGADGSQRRLGGSRASLVIDFAPQPEAAALRSSTIPEPLLLAMFLNNRAAEALSQGRTAQAYWWARAAVLRQPGWAQARNTLAVVYLRAELPALAEATLRPVLARHPDNTVALGNQAQALDALGRADEAQALRTQLAALEPQAPGVHLAQGRAALQRGDAAGALVLFEREAARHGPSPALAHARALALLAQGRLAEADAALAEAATLSAEGPDRQRYRGKQAWLRSLAAGSGKPAAAATGL